MTEQYDNYDSTMKDMIMENHSEGLHDGKKLYIIMLEEIYILSDQLLLWVFPQQNILFYIINICHFKKKVCFWLKKPLMAQKHYSI